MPAEAISTAHYRLFGYSPRGRKVEIGGIWKQRSKQGNEYFQLTAQTPKRSHDAGLPA